MKTSFTLAAALFVCAAALFSTTGFAQVGCMLGGCPAVTPYPNMPEIAPIGVRIDTYMDVPESAKGPAIDPDKGYRIQELGGGLYMVTEGAYQSMFMVYDTGVVVVDAPPTFASLLPAAIAEVTTRPITHIVYSHSHIDHIGGAGGLIAGAAALVQGRPAGARPRLVIVAHDETRKLLVRANDPNRPVPTVTFRDHYMLRVGGQVLELSYHGNGHEPGNIFIYAPGQKVLMVVDVVFPGWMPWRRLGVGQDVPGIFAQVEEIKTIDFDTLVSGHVARSGTHADVDLQSAFMNDLRNAAAQALGATVPGEGMNPADLANPWAVFDNFTDRVVVQCVNTLTPRWRTTLAAFDTFIWDQCYTMEQSLRID
jgi:glyoxylase-like metal-dependent hydrolase (beta-lactamase superfamily II)